METPIEQTKKLIEIYKNNPTFGIHRSEYNQIYFFSNENIKGYIDAAAPKKDQRALSVLSSGDHAFNLIAKGVLNVDTFDLNKLTEYYALGLKFALISKCNYNDFLDTYYNLFSLFTSTEQILSNISDLLPHMDEKYREYWQEIQNFYYKDTKQCIKKYNLFQAIAKEELDIFKARNYNEYLLNQKNYELFKANLMQTNITFTHANALEIPKKFNGQYDYILLSNILDYIYLNWGCGWDINKLNNFIETLKPLIRENGIIFLHYCFDKSTFIYRSNVKEDQFEHHELHRVGELSSQEIIILKRIKIYSTGS